MNKKFVYFLCLAVFAAVVIFIVVRYQSKNNDKENKIYTLLERKAPFSELPDWKIASSQARKFLEVLYKDPNDKQASLGMASLCIQEARITGNYFYYDDAAMQYANRVLKSDSNNFDALIYKSLIYLSQHHFAEGLATAQKAKQINPYNAFVYGILVDGNVEMGYYDSAVANSDRMVAIRPDLRSYSRISYLREIYGDYPGAINAMKLAVDAGVAGEEGTEWARVQSGLLYEKTGDLKNAEMQYLISLEVRPGYPYALAGMARIHSAKKDFNKAIGFYLKADSLMEDYSFKDELVDIYQYTGQKEKAASSIKMVIEKLNDDATKGDSDESIGHYADGELAYAYLKTNEYDKALKHALLEYNRRPDNIGVNESLAWVYYKKGDYPNSLKYINAALKTKCKNPVLLCRAGLIYSKAGDKKTAMPLLQEALAKNPNINLQLKEEGTKVLNGLL